MFYHKILEGKVDLLLGGGENGHVNPGALWSTATWPAGHSVHWWTATCPLKSSYRQCLLYKEGWVLDCSTYAT